MGRGQATQCIIVGAIVILMLSACNKPPKYATAGEDIRSAMNESIATDRAITQKNHIAVLQNKTVSNALLPPLSLPSVKNQKNITENRRFDVSANNLPAKEFFMGLVQGAPDNMLVDNSISGTVTMHLKNVTIEDALSVARDMYGYEYRHTKVGYEVLPIKMATKMFNVDYLNVKRLGQSQTQLVSTEITNQNSGNNSGGGSSTASMPAPPQLTMPGQQNAQSTASVGSGTTVVTKTDNDFWAALKSALGVLIEGKKGCWVVVNPQASMVMVHAYPNQLRRVSEYLKTIQHNLKREVVIEAKILEIVLNDNYQAGIDWKLFSTAQLGATNGPGLTDAFESNGQMFTLNINNKSNFSTVMNFLAQQGNVQVLSSPHISTMNNQEAVIKVGSDQFFVTGYTSNITPTGSTNTTSQSVELNPFFSGITLDVTPQISREGGVTLYIHPSISEVKDQTKTINLGTSGGGSNSTLTLPLALSTIRESDAVVHAENGQIVVIGGLMQNQTEEVIAGTPGLAKIPAAGVVGRNTNQTSIKKELVILLKPIVVGEHTWERRLIAEAKQFERNQRGFHLGGLPEDFGTQGE